VLTGSKTVEAAKTVCQKVILCHSILVGLQEMNKLKAMRLIPVMAIMAAFGSCSSSGGSSQLKQMGEPVQVAELVFTVQEVDWRNEIGSSIPKGRFAVIKLSVTNNGGQEVSVPLLALEDTKGDSFPEVSEVEGLENWLGLLRTLSPADNIQGNIVFDVNPGEYRLRVTGGSDPERERTAFIQIPLSIPKSSPTPELPPPPGQQ
jgi:hypothetical protein